MDPFIISHLNKPLITFELGQDADLHNLSSPEWGGSLGGICLPTPITVTRLEKCLNNHRAGEEGRLCDGWMSGDPGIKESMAFTALIRLLLWSWNAEHSLSYVQLTLQTQGPWWHWVLPSVPAWTMAQQSILPTTWQPPAWGGSAAGSSSCRAAAQSCGVHGSEW